MAKSRQPASDDNDDVPPPPTKQQEGPRPERFTEDDPDAFGPADDEDEDAPE